MSARDRVLPPPWSPPTGLMPDERRISTTNEDEYRFAWIQFPGEGRSRDELISKLRHHPDLLMIIVSSSNRTVFALFRYRDELDDMHRLGDWINALQERRLFERVSMGFVRQGEEMVYFER